jgi:hypothetical protein
VVPGRVITVLAGVAALAVAPAADAQNGFPDFRQAAADQYPQQPPPGNTGSGSEASSSSSGGNEQATGSSGRPRPVHHGTSSGGPKRHPAGAVAPASSGRGAPVAVPTEPVPAAKGSLPFTGSNLSGLVVLALVLIAAGLFLAAVARATRRRRRHAPA